MAGDGIAIYCWRDLRTLQKVIAFVVTFFEGLTRITSISPDFFPKSFNKFAGLKQPEPPEKIYPISVASEQGLDTST